MQNDLTGSCSSANHFTCETEYRKLTQMANLLDFVALKNPVRQLKGHLSIDIVDHSFSEKVSLGINFVCRGASYVQFLCYSSTSHNQVVFVSSSVGVWCLVGKLFFLNFPLCDVKLLIVRSKYLL